MTKQLTQHPSNIYDTHPKFSIQIYGLLCDLLNFLPNLSLSELKNPTTTPALHICLMSEFTHKHFRITTLTLPSPNISE